MKPVYDNIKLKTGAQNSGICKIEIAPISSISIDIEPDVRTGEVKTPVALTGSLYLLEFLKDSCKFKEPVKSSKAGDYYEISIIGTLSALDASVRNILETLRFEKLMVILTEPEKTKRIIGNKTHGMELKYSTENNSSASQIVIELFLSSATTAPYYVI